MKASMSDDEKVIEEIWERYDINKNGYLEKDEMAKFVIDYLIKKGELKSDADFKKD